jgi:hypothetical protein
LADNAYPTYIQIPIPPNGLTMKTHKPQKQGVGSLTGIPAIQMDDNCLKLTN